MCAIDSIHFEPILNYNIMLKIQGKGFAVGPTETTSAHSIAKKAMSTKKVITETELKSHNSTNDCWIALHGKVYNVTNFLRHHPGGAEILAGVAGSDATQEFENAGHSYESRNLVEKYEVGVLEGEGKGSPAQDSLWTKEKPASIPRDNHYDALPMFLVALLCAGGYLATKFFSH